MKIAIMGFGVVGSGVGEIVLKNQKGIAVKCGENVEIAHILDLRDFPESEFKCFTKDFNDILSDPEVGIVVETMGGVNPAYKFTKELLLAGKHVITSNKELVAAHGAELLSIAEQKNINYLFEASVGGGIPIIRPLYSCLTAGIITDVIGILNGTTNYILTQMFQSGVSFENALRDAQKKGYAEKDPTADIEGLDTCRKIAILSSLAYGKAIDSSKVETEGITNITAADVAYAEKAGYSIKLIGYSSREGKNVYAAVFPAFVSKQNPLSGINDVFNGIVVKGDDLGDVMFYGRGAGKLPTANAVVSDIIDAVKHKHTHIIIQWNEYDEERQSSGENHKFSYYVRLRGEIPADVCGCEKFTLDSAEFEGEFAIITPEMTEAELDGLLSDTFGGCGVLAKMRLIK